MEVRDVHALLGRTAYDVDGDRLGTITGAYLDNATGRPSWVTVERGGLFRSTRSFVPMDGVELVDDAVRVAVAADAVRRAPQVDDDRELTREDEEQLLRHYGVGQPAEAAAPEPGPDPAGGGAAQTERQTRTEPQTRTETETEPETETSQAAMTRSEERVRVGTTTVPASRAVLRTTRVVEDRTFSGPLGRDQVQVAYEPLPDPGPEPVTAQAPQGSSPGRQTGRDDDGDDGWVVLYEERLVVRTEWVPVERVRLRTVGVQGEEVVNVDLRRERIDVEQAGQAGQAGQAEQAEQAGQAGQAGQTGQAGQAGQAGRVGRVPPGASDGGTS
jgi:stress response protein YsnF